MLFHLRRQRFRMGIISLTFCAGVLLVSSHAVSALFASDQITEDVTPASVRVYPEGHIFLTDPPYEEDTTAEWEYGDVKREKSCLASNIYFEARGQSTEGQVAVALVTINRVKSHDFPNNICEVVWQRTKSKAGKTVAQFSWTLDGKPDVPTDVKAWEKSKRLADAILAGSSLNNFYDFTDGALYYHANYVNPNWEHLTMLATVGDHIFYKE